ncbi:MAG TPA: acyloxyacyl hydrolase [Chthoniobacterales bacterium]|jgi:opacity protein-like surface antigen
MKLRRALFLLALTACVQFAPGGEEAAVSSPALRIEEPPTFQLALESAYILGIFNPPHSYELNADFLTARLRWGTYLNSTGIFRGYNQFYFSAITEPIIRGIENHYFGLNFGLRYNFVPRGSRLTPYVSGGLGLGWIDSQPEQLGGQGQDFTFNILAAAGISYKFSERLSGQIGLLYQHLSNGGQTDPNPSLNLLGPQIGLTFSF